MLINRRYDQGSRVHRKESYIVKSDRHSKTIRFAVMTDPHVAVGETTNTWKMLCRTESLFRDHLRLAAEACAEFVLLPGDLTKDSEPWNHEVARQILEEQSLPVYIVPGNHDVRKLKWPAERNWGIVRFAPF